MSYILEALKQSEHERLRGAATTRYSLQPALGMEQPRPRTWHYPLLAAALLVNAVLFYPRQHPAAADAALPPPVPTAATSQPKMASAPAAPARVATVPPQAHGTPSPPVARPSTSAAAARPVRMAEDGAAAHRDGPPAPAAPAQLHSAAADGKEVASDVPHQLPAITVAGYIRDGNANMVIVNDKLLHAGDEVEPGLTLESILGDGLVFNYKGYRFKR